MERTRRQLLAVLGTSSAVALAGCSGDDGSEDSDGGDGSEDSDGDDGGSSDEDPDTGDGDPETDGEQTGEQSTDQVADNINVLDTIGEVNSSNEAVELLKLTVRRTPVSDNVDLSDLSIQYVGDNGLATYSHTGEDPDDAYGVEIISAASSDAIVTDNADRYRILLPLGGASYDGSSGGAYEEAGDSGNTVTISAGSLDSGLGAGGAAEIEITTGEGATRSIVIQTPDTLPAGTVTL